MQTLYVLDGDTDLRKRGERLLLRREGRVVGDVPLAHVDNVIVFGNVSLSAPTVQLFMDNGIPVSFLSYGGRFRGRLTPAATKGAVLRQAQYRAAEDAQTKLELAKAFVRGKLLNIRNRLLRFSRQERRMSQSGQGEPPAGQPAPGSEETPRADAELRRVAREVNALLAGLDRTTTLDALRGVEGHATRLYFSGFRQRVRNSGFQFERRTRRPPRDPVNALLSFGYALLQAQIDGFVQAVGLDPYVGYLHEVRHGKPSLVLDLMEEFRPVFVDGLVLTLLNRQQMQPHHFKEQLGGVEMTDEGRRVFLGEFEERLRTEFTHPLLKERVTWRRCFEVQVRILARALLGQIPAYVPFVQR